MMTSAVSQADDTLFNHELWRKYILTILFGNVACIFDFVILLHLSDVIGKAFFPNIDNPLIGHLKVIALFGVGFLSRPIGSYLIGRYGDNKGRKPALIACLLIFTICAFVIAFLPTYAQIGLFAPIIFVVIRLIQGMALGSQMILGWVFIAEHAPKNTLALYSSFATASLVVANLLAYLIANFLESLLSQSMLLSLGWRIPFVIGGIFSVIALILERQLVESPLFLQHQIKRKKLNPSSTRNKKPKSSILKMPALNQWQAIFLTSALAFVQISLVMVTLIAPQIIAMNFNFEGNFLVMTYISTLVCLIFGCIFFGWLADRVNVGKVMVGGAFFLIIQSLLFYIYLTNHSNYMILIMCSLFGFLSGIRVLCPVIFVQLFSTENRLTYVSVTFNCVSAILGASLPMALFHFTNIISATPGLYLTFIGLILGMLGLIVQYSPELYKFEELETDN